MISNTSYHACFIKPFTITAIDYIYMKCKNISLINIRLTIADKVKHWKFQKFQNKTFILQKKKKLIIILTVLPKHRYSQNNFSNMDEFFVALQYPIRSISHHLTPHF